MTDSELREHIAYHEAGHAVLGYKLGIPGRPYGQCPVVTIKEGEESAQNVTDEFAIVPPEEIEDIQLALRAGAVTEKIFFGCVGDEHRGDRCKIVRLEWGKRKCEKKPPLPDEDVLLKELAERAESLLDTPECRKLIEAVAKGLLKHETLDFDQFMQIVRAESEAE